MSLISIAQPMPFDSLLSLKGKTAIVTGGSKGIGRQNLREHQGTDGKYGI